MKDLPYIVLAGQARIGAFPTMRRAVEFIEWRKTAARVTGEPIEYRVVDSKGKPRGANTCDWQWANRRLAKEANMSKRAITTDPTLAEMVEYLTPLYGDEADEFDIHEAAYAFACDYHYGQWTNLYAAICASPFKPGPIWNGCEPDSMSAMLYEALEAEFA